MRHTGCTRQGLPHAQESVCCHSLELDLPLRLYHALPKSMTSLTSDAPLSGASLLTASPLHLVLGKCLHFTSEEVK